MSSDAPVFDLAALTELAESVCAPTVVERRPRARQPPTVLTDADKDAAWQAANDAIQTADVTAAPAVRQSQFRRRKADAELAAKPPPAWEGVRRIDPNTLFELAPRPFHKVHNGDISSRSGEMPVRAVKSVQFDVMSERDVKDHSVMKVTSSKEIERIGENLYQPASGGLVAEELGPIEHKKMCPTCLGTNSHPSFLKPSGDTGYACPGHFGNLELAGALYNPEFSDIMMNILRSYCWHCGQFPGSDVYNAGTIAELSKRDVNGRPLSRLQRISLLAARYGKMQTCAQCRKDDGPHQDQHCSRCPTANEQCEQCASPTWFRPQITKLQKKPFDSFPYLLHYPVQSAASSKAQQAKRAAERLQAAYLNYLDRLEITDTELELNPERARFIVSKMGASVARWFIADLDDDPDKDDPQERLRRVKSWIYSYMSRDLPHSPNAVRPTDTSEGLQKPRFNELTTGMRDIMECDTKIRATQLSVDQAAQNHDRRFGNGILRFKPDEKWYHRSTADTHFVAELYGRLQYYWAIMVRASRAMFWLPTGNRSIKVPDKARKGAEQTPNKGRSYMGDMGGKHGNSRKNMQGGRCDFSGRSVIVPDPNLLINEVGLSPDMAARITTPVQICGWNFERVLRLAEALRAHGTRTASSRGLQYMMMNEERTLAVPYLDLKTPVMAHQLATVGSWVELPLQDGDVVVMNRQPSLHKPSMMAHRVRIMPCTSPVESSRANVRYHCSPAMRLKPDVVTNYNADFDGDEMTMHVAQSAGARAEAVLLMDVTQHFVLSKHGRASTKLRQNHLLTAYLVTKDHKFLTREEFMTLATQTLPSDSDLWSCLPMPAIVHPEPLWTMRQMIELLIPSTITMHRGSLHPQLLNCVPERDHKEKPPALIERGKFHYGVMDNNLMTTILESLYMSAAPDNLPGSDVRGTVPDRCVAAATDFLNSMASLTENYLADSFSIGVEDVLTDVPLRTAPLADRNCTECRFIGQPIRAPPVDIMLTPPDYMQDSHERLLYRHLGALEYGAWRQARGVDEGLATVVAGAMSEWPAVPRQSNELRSYIALRPLLVQFCERVKQYFGKAIDACWPRYLRRRPCAECVAKAVSTPSFAVDVVPSSVRNTAEYPCDRDVWRRIGPIKFDAWCRTRQADAECRDMLSATQRDWDDNRWLYGAPNDQSIDQLETSMLRYLEKEPLALPINAAEHDAALELWQRIGPTKYAIRQRLDQVVPRVDAVTEKARVDWTEAYKKGRQPLADDQIDNCEAAIRRECQNARTETHAIVFSSLPTRNSFRAMVDAETKGKLTNSGECMACVGPQEIDGARLADRVTMMLAQCKASDDSQSLSSRSLYDPANRLLPHDVQRYPGAIEGGFIPETFVDGLRPCSFWYQAMAGRAACINTATGTAPIGYMARRIGKVGEGLVVDQHGMIRATDGTIVEMRIGAGYDPMFVTGKVLPPITMSERALRDSVLIAPDDYCVYGMSERRALVERESRLLREAVDYLRGMRDADGHGTIRTVNSIERIIVECSYSSDACRHTACSNSLSFGRCASPSWSPPEDDLEYTRWRRHIISLQRYGNSRLPTGGVVPERGAASDLDLLDECEAIRMVGEWLDRLKHCDDVTRCELRLRLCAKQLVRRHCMSKLTLLSVMHCYEGWLRRAAAVPGDAVGIVAAQSFTSEGMQMTLSSFHATGATNMAVSEGMPRALEVVGARTTEKMDTPKVSVYLSQSGFATRQAYEATEALVNAALPVEKHGVYHAAWRALGRDEHESQLAAIERRQAELKVEMPTAPRRPRASRKKTTRDAETEYESAIMVYEQASHEARLTFGAELGVALDEALACCDSAAERQFTVTLDALFDRWTVGKTALDLRVASAYADTSRERAEFFCEYVLWDALLPLAGAERSLQCKPSFRESAWIGVRIEHSAKDALEHEQFYNAARKQRRLLHVQWQWRDDARAMLMLDYAQSAVWQRAKASTLGRKECIESTQYTVDAAVTALHRRMLRQMLFVDIVDKMEIVYAPLEPELAGEKGELRLKDQSLAPSPMLAYLTGGGCTRCGDVVGTCGDDDDGRGKRGPKAKRKIVNQYSRSEPETRCLSAFVLSLSLSAAWLRANDHWCIDEIEPSIARVLGPGHTIVFARHGAEPTVHIRLHRCALDVLMQRTPSEQRLDFCEPLLDQDLLGAQQALVVADDQHDNYADGAVSRIRRLDDDFDRPYFMLWLRAYMRDVLVGGTRKRTRQHRAPKKNRVVSPGVADDDALKLTRRSVARRIMDERSAELAEQERRGSLARIRRVPPAPLPDAVGEPLYKAHGRDAERLIEEESEQLCTQFEIDELLTSWRMLADLRLGGSANTGAQRIVIESHQTPIYTPESGTEMISERVVAIDSRNFLRVMNERCVDKRRTVTNAIQDTYQVLGTLAARERTRGELAAIIASGHTFIDHAHLGVLAAVQWFKGWCVPFTIHGLKYVSDDVIQKMSMEATPLMIREAVINRQRNDIVSASTCIAFGQGLRRIGTETIDIKHDRHMKPAEGAYGRQFTALEMACLDLFADELQAAEPTLADPFARFGHLREAMAGATPPHTWDDEAVAESDDDDMPDQYGSNIARFSPQHDETTGVAIPEYDPVAEASAAGTASMLVDSYDPVSNFAMGGLDTLLNQQESLLLNGMSFVLAN